MDEPTNKTSDENARKQPSLADYLKLTDHVKKNRPQYENKPYPQAAKEINEAMAGELSVEITQSHVRRLSVEAGLPWLGTQSRRQGQEKAVKTRETSQAIKDLQAVVNSLVERLEKVEQGMHERYALQEAGSSNGRYETARS